MSMGQFQDSIVNFGLGGLDLRHPAELVPLGKFTRLTNVTRSLEGSWVGRPGQTGLFTIPDAAAIHTIARLNNVQAGNFLRVVGAGTKLYTGVSGALTQVTGGGTFSGDPLTIVPLRPPLSSDAWGYIGDSAQMMKVRGSDALMTTIGLSRALTVGGKFRIDEFAATPNASISTADRARLVGVGFDIATGGTGTSTFANLVAASLRTIDNCDSAGWTNNTGTGSGAPSNATDAADKKAGTGSLKLTTNGPASSYYQFWSKTNARNLSTFSDDVQASDDDIVHMWMKTDRPDLVQEIRLYLVLNSAFDLNTVPGTSATLNTDAYLKTVRPADFTQLYEASVVTLPSASAYNSAAQTLSQLSTISDTRTVTDIIKQQTESLRALSLTLAPGRAQWTELGTTGAAFYRGDFRRIGSDTTVGWGTVSGVVILVVMASGNANIWLDDLRLNGGSGPDTSPIGETSYDYRYRNYDPRTGVKGNPSDVQSGRFAIDPMRQAVTLTPTAYGDSEIRQQFFRRGGSLVSNWYFLGVNTADGAVFTDIFSDDQLKAADILDIDNDRPITTTAADGSTVYEVPLPSIWGPVLDVLIGCGDPNRPGYVSWSKQGEYDHWPVNNNAEVCGPSEELMAGCVFLGQGYVFSRQRCFNCYVNLAGGGVVTPTPTACRHGLVSRWGLAVGVDGIYFVSNDGIYKTSGNVEESITDNDLFPLFHGEARNGYLPVDFTHPEAMRLEIHQNDLWFLYRDSGGTNRVLVYSLLYQFWRFYAFGRELSALHCENEIKANPVMVLGGRSLNAGYTFSGQTDDGLAIAGNVRTGALDQGSRRADKLYGDLFVDCDRQGGTLTLTPYVNSEALALQAQVISSSASRHRYLLDTIDALGNPGPFTARDIALDLAWSVTTPAPQLFLAGVSYIIQPDEVTQRASDWDSAGTPSDKFFKGVILEIDTHGADKAFTVEVDGVAGVAATSFTINTPSRQVVELSWPKFRARIVRIRPAGPGSIQVYDLRWIHDEEPYSLLRWESEGIDFGLNAPGGLSLLYANVVLLSTAAVTLQVTITRNDGSQFVLSPDPLASTAGAKQQIFVPFVANKGVFSRWIFTSTAPFYLYREESEVAVQPWAGDMTVVKPFGNDDLDPTRGMISSEAASARSGGAYFGGRK